MPPLGPCSHHGDTAREPVVTVPAVVGVEDQMCHALKCWLSPAFSRHRTTVPAMGSLDGKVALITGAARGQGRSHALALASEGADVIAVDFCEDIESNDYPLARPEDLAATAKVIEALHQRVYRQIVDVRDRTGLIDAINKGVSELG